MHSLLLPSACAAAPPPLPQRHRCLIPPHLRELEGVALALRLQAQTITAVTEILRVMACWGGCIHPGMRCMRHGCMLPRIPHACAAMRPRRPRRPCTCMIAQIACSPATGASTHHDVARHEHNHAPRDGWLEVRGSGLHFALRERQLGQLANNGLCSLKLLTLKCQHAGILVQARQARPIRGEQVVVVLQEGLRDHFMRSLCMSGMHGALPESSTRMQAERDRQARPLALTLPTASGSDMVLYLSTHDGEGGPRVWGVASAVERLQWRENQGGGGGGARL